MEIFENVQTTQEVSTFVTDILWKTVPAQSHQDADIKYLWDK